jgi:hypothetical protein
MRIGFWLVCVLLFACTVPAENAPASSSPAASASASAVARPVATPPDPVLWRLDIPRRTDRYFVRPAPSGRLAVAADLDASTFAFFDLRGSQIAWYDAQGLDILWWRWLEDSSGLLVARRELVNGGAVTELSVFAPYRGNRTVVGEARTDPDEPVLSPDGKWLAFASECCPQRIVASRLDGSEQRVLFTSPVRISLLGWDARSRVMYADSRKLHWVGLDSKPSDEAAIDLELPAGVNAVGVRILRQSPDRAAAFVGMFADRPFPGAGSNNYGIRRLVGERLYEPTSLGNSAGWLNDSELVNWERPPAALNIVTGSTRSLGISDDQREATALSGRILLAQGDKRAIYVLRIGIDTHYRLIDPGVDLDCAAPISDGLFLCYGADGWLYVMDGEVAARP